jgi:hypothetical protein
MLITRRLLQKSEELVRLSLQGHLLSHDHVEFSPSLNVTDNLK